MKMLGSNVSNSLQLKLIRKYLKLKILEDNISFNGHTQERKHVYDIFRGTVVSGESHSALMIGPRGAGKTTLINSALHQLSKEADLANDAIIVKLNGLIHVDDKTALKSITAQMQLENAVGDRVFGSFAENLAFLLSCLKSGVDRQCKSMIFILEEFDMFCRSGRTQTLLYNLFDITHSKQSPMCVIGTTNRFDVMEQLEKRVKSRFSHRHIFIFPNEDSGGVQISPIDMFRERLLRLLSMPEVLQKKQIGTPKKGRGRKKSVSRNAEDEMETDTSSHYALPEDVLLRCKVDPKQFHDLDPSYVEDWNSHIQALDGDQKIEDALEKFTYYTLCEQVFRNMLFQIVCKISPNKPYIDTSDILSTIDITVAPEHRVKLLQSLSILELSLIIAMKHGMEIFDGQPMNFEMVLHRYTKFANIHSSTQNVPRPVILKAFEHLQVLEIILPVRSTDSIYNHSDTTASRVQKEYQLYTLAVPNEDIQEAVKGYKALPTEIHHWFSNSVV